MYFDSHCHLNDPSLLTNLDEVIKRAKDNGVTLMNIIGYDLSSSKKAIEIANKYEGIYATVGIHPNDLHKMNKNDFDEIEKLLTKDKVIAVGEIGLDYHYEDTYKDLQKEYLVKFLHLANKYKKPIVIHVRDALNDALTIFKEHKSLIIGGVMHCYSGSKEMAKEFVKLGLYIGVDGPVTFLNARVIKEVVSDVPLEWLLIETDCPYLTPHPYRGKRNEPSYLPLIAQKIAELKNLSVEEVAFTTTNNAKRLFNL
jgi:TatD DNase family protein